MLMAFHDFRRPGNGHFKNFGQIQNKIIRIRPIGYFAYRRVFYTFTQTQIRVKWGNQVIAGIESPNLLSAKIYSYRTPLNITLTKGLGWYSTLLDDPTLPQNAILQHRLLLGSCRVILCAHFNAKRGTYHLHQGQGSPEQWRSHRGPGAHWLPW